MTAAATKATAAANRRMTRQALAILVERLQRSGQFPERQASINRVLKSRRKGDA